MPDFDHINPDLIHPFYEELRQTLPVLPLRVDREAWSMLTPDLASRAFALPLVWAESLGANQFGYRANAARLALLLANEAPPAVAEHLADYATMLGMCLAQDVAASIHDAGPAMLEELVAAPNAPLREVSAEDRARVRQAAHAMGMELHEFEAALRHRTIH